MGAIISALVHRIPSKLCSKECLDESSARMTSRENPVLHLFTIKKIKKEKKRKSTQSLSLSKPVHYNVSLVKTSTFVISMTKHAVKIPYLNFFLIGIIFDQLSRISKVPSSVSNWFTIQTGTAMSRNQIGFLGADQESTPSQIDRTIF